MKKICICTTISGTMNAFVVETAIYLHKKNGYDITLICNDDEKFKDSLPKYLHFIPVNMSRGIDFSAIKSIIHFIKVFKVEKFDMVQYSTPNAAFYASIAASIAKVPIRLYCQWGIRYVGMKGIYRKIFKDIEKMICRNSTDIRAVSSLNKNFAVSEGLYSQSRAVVIGNGGTIGVDMSKYDIQKKEIWSKSIREKYNISSKDLVFGFAGRVSKDKGCIELLEAFKKLTKDYASIKLLIIGPVEINCGIPEDIVTWARDSSQVIMTGRIDSSIMNKFYSAIDVLVHPTYREGFGMVLQEAGALGIAMITTKIPGASEVMEDSISCILVEPKNIPELEKAMKRFISEKDLIQKMGRAAYNRTRKYYDRMVMLENQRRDYIKILGEEPYE